MKKWFSDLAHADHTAAMPILTSPGVTLIPGCNMNHLVHDSDVQVRVLQLLAKRYSSCASMTPMDLSVESEAFGCPIMFSDNEVPTVSARIVENIEQVNSLAVPKPGDGRTSIYLETARRAKEAITDRPVFGGIIGPYSLAARLYDITEMMIAVLADPETVHPLLEKCAAFLTEYAKAFKDAGADGIIMAEPAAGLLSPDTCDEFSSANVKRIVAAVQDENFAVILHNCGNTVSLVESMASTGAMGLHFGNAVRLTDILPQVPSDRIAFGNLDPVGLFKNSSVSEVKNAAVKLMQQLSSYPNYVISSGCDIPPGTPLENIDAFFEAVGGAGKR